MGSKVSSGWMSASPRQCRLGILTGIFVLEVGKQAAQHRLVADDHDILLSLQFLPTISSITVYDTSFKYQLPTADIIHHSIHETTYAGSLHVASFYPVSVLA